MIGEFFAGALNYLGQKEANATNLQIAKENNEWNERMWHMQNAYNSPAEQMARYKAAGLNPNLIYGNASNGNANSFPTAQNVSVQNTRLGDALQGLDFLGYYFDLMKKREELRTQKATTANINANTIEKNNENSLFGLTSQMRATELQGMLRKNELYLQQHKLNEAEYEKIMSENENIKAQLQVIKKQAEKYGTDVLLNNIQARMLGKVNDFREEGENYGRTALDTIGKWIGGKIADFVRWREGDQSYSIYRKERPYIIGRNGGYSW